MSEDNTIGGLQKTNTKIKWHKTGKNTRIIKSMPGKYKQKSNRDHNIIIKVEVRENNILLDKESDFIAHFTWIKDKPIKNIYALNNISLRYTKQKLSEIQRNKLM